MLLLSQYFAVKRSVLFVVRLNMCFWTKLRTLHKVIKWKLSVFNITKS